MYEEIKATPIGMFSLLAIGLTASCFPLMAVMGLGHTFSVVLIVISSVLFSPALVCSVYSIVFEKPRLFGFAALLCAGITLLTERKILNFFEMGLFLAPCTVLVLRAAKRRVKNRRLQISQANR